MLFRGYDIRGVYPNELNRKVAEKIGKAFGTFLDGETVVVGHDTRDTSKKIVNSFINGVRSTGCEVINIGMVPNPALYYYAFNKKIFGAYITASHNPPEYTGVKFVKPNGVSFSKELIIIKEAFELNKFSEGYGYLEKDPNGLEMYENFLMKNFSVENKMIVETYGGVAQLVVDDLRKNGFNIQSIRKGISGNFFGKRPEPKKGNLVELKKRLKKEKVNFSVAFD